MRLWIDPPSGWKYGFPKIWDSETDENVLSWLVKKGYPQKNIDELGEVFYTRNWRVDDNDLSNP